MRAWAWAWRTVGPLQVMLSLLLSKVIIVPVSYCRVMTTPKFGGLKNHDGFRSQFCVSKRTKRIGCRDHRVAVTLDAASWAHQVCDAGAEARPLHRRQLTPLPLPTPPAPASREAVPTSHPPQPPPSARPAVPATPTHPRILQEAHFCLQRVLLEASRGTLGGGVTGLAPGLTLLQARRQMLGK